MDGLAAKLTSFKLCVALPMCFNIGCGVQMGPEKVVSPSMPTLQTVAVVRVTESPDELRTVVFYGKLVAEESAALRFLMAGQVERVEAAVGDQKKQGDVLAVMAQPKLASENAKLERQLLQLKESYKNSLSPEREQIREQFASVQVQQKQLDSQFSNGLLTAPFDCIVRHVGVEAGKSSSPIVAAFDLVADRQPIVVGQLPDVDVQQLPPDQQIWVAIADKAVKCRIRKANSGGDKVVAEFLEPLSRKFWLFDNVIEARLSLQTETEGYWLPIDALGREASNRWSVLAARTDVATDSESVLLEARTVNVLRTKVDSVLVAGAINVGDFVVGAGIHRVVAGQRVVVRPVDDDVVAPTGADL